MSDILTSMRNGELPPHLINQLRPEIMGVHALNPGVAYNSPSRNTMMSSHISQHLVTEKMDIPLTIAGPEVEYSKSTVSSRVPCDATVFDTIERYPRGVTGNSLSFNPETLVVYCDEETGSYGFVSIPYHTSLHQYFGFKNVKTEAASRLTPGTPLPRDTVLADTPANIGRFYTATTNANVALMAEAGTAEDGVVACEESLENFAYHVFERRSASVGQKKFPIRIGGEGKYYKCFPDIGEEVPESGELLYLREYVEGLSPVLMSERATREVDYTFDDIVHARQGLKGRVVDIRVKGNADTISALPVQMTEQFEKYRQALIRYYKAILETERRMIRDSARRFGTTYPNITSEFTRLLIEARALTNHDAKRHGKNLQLVENRNVLDQYRIEFVVEYRVVPDIGSKLTSISGDTTN